MSTVKEIADREAAEAEASETEAEPGEGDGDAEPDGEPDQGEQDGGPTEEQLKAFERENTRHEKALQRIMGADFALWTLCGHCEGVGFAFAPYVAPVELTQAPDAETCETCKGLGQMLTGSLVDGSRTKGCPTCGGVGWTTVVQQLAAVVSADARGWQPSVGPDQGVATGELRAAQETLQRAGYVTIPPTNPGAAAPGA